RARHAVRRVPRRRAAALPRTIAAPRGRTADAAVQAQHDLLRRGGRTDALLTAHLLGCRRIPMAPLRSTPFFLLGTLLCGGCEDSLLDGNYRGMPVYTFERNAQWALTGPADVSDLRAALFFSPQGLEITAPDQWVEFPASGVPILDLPSRLVVNVFAWPSEE